MGLRLERLTPDAAVEDGVVPDVSFPQPGNVAGVKQVLAPAACHRVGWKDYGPHEHLNKATAADWASDKVESRGGLVHGQLDGQVTGEQRSMTGAGEVSQRAQCCTPARITKSSAQHAGQWK